MSIGTGIGVAIAIGLSAALRRRRANPNASRLRSVGEGLLIGCVAGVAWVGGYFAFSYYQSWQATNTVTARAMEEFKSTPLVRELISDIPNFEKLVSEAARAGDISPVTAKIVELREQRVKPAIRSASDPHIERVWEAQNEVVHWLSSNNTPMCAEFFLVGLNNPLALGDEFMGKYTQLLYETEAAYRFGRGKAFLPTVDEETLAEILVYDIGFTQQDFDALNEPQQSNSRYICDLALKIIQRVPQVSAQQRLPFLRTLLSM